MGLLTVFRTRCGNPLWDGDSIPSETISRRPRPCGGGGPVRLGALPRSDPRLAAGREAGAGVLDASLRGGLHALVGETAGDAGRAQFLGVVVPRLPRRGARSRGRLAALRAGGRLRGHRRKRRGRRREGVHPQVREDLSPRFRRRRVGGGRLRPLRRSRDVLHRTRRHDPLASHRPAVGRRPGRADRRARGGRDGRHRRRSEPGAPAVDR